MSQDQSGSGTTGCLIAAIVVVLLVVCGGGALVVAGALLFYRLERSAALPAPAPPAAVAHADVLAVEADGSLLWNGTPLEKAELTRRLDELKAMPGPPRSVIVHIDPAAPPAASDEMLRLLTDHSVDFIIEGS